MEKQKFITLPEFSEKYGVAHQTIYNVSKDMEKRYGEKRELLIEDSVANKWLIPQLRKEIIEKVASGEKVPGLPDFVEKAISLGWID